MGPPINTIWCSCNRVTKHLRLIRFKDGVSVRISWYNRIVNERCYYLFDFIILLRCITSLFLLRFAFFPFAGFYRDHTNGMRSFIAYPGIKWRYNQSGHMNTARGSLNELRHLSQLGSVRNMIWGWTCRIYKVFILVDRPLGEIIA
jgi:hypothetical protein